MRPGRATGTAIGLTVAALSAGAGLVRWWRRQFLVVTVHGASMRPALTSGSRVLVRRVKLGQLRTGQVVVARQPNPGAGPAGELMIKRVAAVPGQAIPADCREACSAAGQTSVPAGTFVVLGDNRALSYDSRQAGLIAGRLLIGIAVRPVGPGRSGRVRGPNGGHLRADLVGLGRAQVGVDR
jgi:signal peptidase I